MICLIHRGHDTATGHRGHDTATGHRGHDTATVVIAVGASTINRCSIMTTMTSCSIMTTMTSCSIMTTTTSCSHSINHWIGIAITPITITNRGDSISHYSIYPAIRNGLSFNKKTGGISGVPIYKNVLDCVAGFPRARLIVLAPTAITTVAVS
jgi:hypothetical protein